MKRKTMGAIGAAVSALLLVVAIPAAASAAGPKKTIKVRLFEFQIKVKPSSSAIGAIKVVAKNIGTEKHEMVVVKGADIAALPLKPDGSVDEDLIPETDKPGEIAEFKAKKTKTKSYNLDPGSYIMFCNIVDTETDGSTLSHFHEGMHTVFTVG